MPRVARERPALAELGEDLVCIVERLRLGGGRRRQVDFADSIFFGPLRRVQLVDHRLDLIVADRDVDLGALQPLPCDLAFDLTAQRLNIRSMGVEEAGELRGSLLHVAGHAIQRAVDFRGLDIDLLCLRRLDLECFVNEVTKHLVAQPLGFLGGDLPAVRDHQQRHALVDVGRGDDVAVDDRRRLDDRRHGVAEHLRIFRKLQRLGAVDRALFGPGFSLPGILRDGAARCGKRCRPDGHPQTRLSHSKSYCHDQIFLISQCPPMLPAR